MGGGMLETLKRAWLVPDLRRRLLFTVLMIVIFRVGGNIPVPGIDRPAFTSLLQRFGQLGSLMDIMSGGALATVSIFAMGITPYINASIIIQLMTVAIPYLEQLSKEGEGAEEINDCITRGGALALIEPSRSGSTPVRWRQGRCRSGSTASSSR